MYCSCSSFNLLLNIPYKKVINCDLSQGNHTINHNFKMYILPSFIYVVICGFNLAVLNFCLELVMVMCKEVGREEIVYFQSGAVLNYYSYWVSALT